MPSFLQTLSHLVGVTAWWGGGHISSYRWGNEAIDCWTWTSGVGVMKDADTASPLHVGLSISPISEHQTHTRGLSITQSKPSFLINFMWSRLFIEHICSWVASSVQALMAHMSSKIELASDALVGHGPFSHEGACPLPRLQVFRRRSLALAHSPIYSFIAYKRNRVISKMQTKESKGHWFLKHCTWVVPEKSSITVISRNTEKVQISGSHPNVLIKEGWVQCSNLQVFKTPLAHQPHWPWCPARFGVLSNSKYLLEVDNLSSRNPKAEEPTALEGLLWNPSLCSDTRCFLRNSLLCLNFVLWYKSKKMLTPSFVQNLLFEAKCPYFQNIF